MVGILFLAPRCEVPLLDRGTTIIVRCNAR